ncbi:MAG: hypothetical protein NTZ79_11435 [Proteobacteria bacterium]|nr:hypothetical protein [Pseudomonadota bacterium]
MLNTGGNLGGVLTNLVMGVLVDAGAWNGAFVMGTIVSLIAAGLWLLIDPDRRLRAAG